MIKEQLTEEGFVLKSENGIAEVELYENDNCEECSAKLFCTSSVNSKSIYAVDPFTTNPGDKVKISVSGASVTKATFLLYGIPLILLVLIIIVGMILFESTSQPELYSSLCSVTVLGVYYSIFYLTGKRNGITSNPVKIISVVKSV